MFGKIKQGMDITLENGTILRAKDYIGPDVQGRIVTILGDTQPCQYSLELARDADILVHEATFAEVRSIWLLPTIIRQLWMPLAQREMLAHML